MGIEMETSLIQGWEWVDVVMVVLEENSRIISINGGGLWFKW